MPDFKLLGPIEVLDERDRPFTPSGPKVRQVLSLLALNPGKIVDVNLFVNELWGEEAPKDQLNTLQTHIYHLRRILDRVGPPAGRLVVTRAPGYLLRVDPQRVDALVFPRLVEEGARHYRAGDHATAEQVLRKALDLWSGPALADVRRGAVLGPHATALEEQRLRALEMHMDARILQGLHGELIEELRVLVAAHPLNENFHAQLITSLSRAGRRTDAFRAYEGLRALLDAELGVEPTFDIKNLQPNSPAVSHSGKEV
ncbi:AfsR/SARP family transcriptional regulator [Sphaerisporangium viridialbum]|uniref:AfsR/SARP family transcriptional regulator n=1 Tax=Sphaerisporangium viridialbum TaxID=46189 RepID=UPI003C7965BF